MLLKTRLNLGLKVITLLVSLAMSQTAHGWQTDRTNVVEFFVSDGFGIDIHEDAVITIFSNDGGESPLLVNYPKRRSVRLPPGAYTVLVEATGLIRKTQSLRIDDQDLFVPMALAVAPVEKSPNGSSVLARIVGVVGARLKGDSPQWVRLVGAFHDINRTARVDETGAFTIEKVPPGRYLIMVYAKGVLKDSRTIELRSYENKVTLD